MLNGEARKSISQEAVPEQDLKYQERPCPTLEEGGYSTCKGPGVSRTLTRAPRTLSGGAVAPR